MAYYYSASERAFFSTDLMTTGAMPSDKVLVDDSTYASLQAAQVAGKIIRTGAAGAPEAVSQSLKTLAGLELGVDLDVEGLTAKSLSVEGSSALSDVNAANLSTSGTLTSKGAANLSGGTTTTTLKATGTSTLAAVNATTVTASGAIKGASLTATGALVGGSLQITGTSATVGGKNVVRSVNGSTANASGEVTLGPDVIQYKSGLSSIKSVAGTFTFDSNSGISADDLPEESSTSDWTGVQFGMKNGNDKVQFIFNGRECYFRFSDTHLGSEVWNGSSWKKYDLSDLAQDSAVVHKAGSETISGAKTLTGGMAVVDTMIVRDLSAVKGTNPSSACFMGIWFADKNAVPGAATTNANVLGAIEAAIRSDGTSDVKMYSNRNEAGTDDRAQIMVGWRFDSAGVLVPSTFLTNTVSMVGYETQRTYRVFRIEKDGDNADNFVISGANQTTFLCSGEIGYDDPDAAAVRAALRKSAEDVVIASDNRVVIASNCNSRDISQVKIAYLDSSGYFHLPVDPVSSSNDDSIPTTRWVRANTVPPGTILPFAGTTVPTGFLLCNGALVSRTTYATLFAAIGTKWGAGDGKTTFKLPDLRKRHLEGANTTSEVGGYLEAGLPNITGSFISVWSNNPVSGAFSRSSGSGHTKEGTDNDGQTIKFDASVVSGAYGASTTVQPASAKVLFIVKT